MIKSILLFFTVTIFLVGCGPVYKTDYSYTPPTSNTGKACTAQCESMKQQCYQFEDLKKESCFSRAELDYRNCKDDHQDDHNYCFKRTCDTNYDRCETNYRSCYETCGGKITSKQVCEYFCK